MNPRPLTAEQVASFRLDRVTVAVAPDAPVSWAGGELEFAESKGVSAPDTTSAREDFTSARAEYATKLAALTKTDEARQFVRVKAGAILQEELQSALAGRLSGRQPIRLDVTLRRLTVQNPALRILVDNEDELVADINIVDGASGRSLATYPSLKVEQRNSGGFAGMLIQNSLRGDAHRALSKLYASRFQSWLLQN